MTNSAVAIQPHYRPIQRLQLMALTRDDPYAPKRKPAEPSVCEGCGVIWSKGHWHWGEAPAAAGRLLCPACRRTREHMPAGTLTLSGPAVVRHRAELLGLIRNHERRERSEHPMQRIVAIEDDGAAVRVTTTDIHLARGLGEAVHSAHQGRLDYHYNDAEHLLRVEWEG